MNGSTITLNISFLVRECMSLVEFVGCTDFDSVTGNIITVKILFLVRGAHGLFGIHLLVMQISSNVVFDKKFTCRNISGHECLVWLKFTGYADQL